jgi:hypothetical protein
MQGTFVPHPAMAVPPLFPQAAAGVRPQDLFSMFKRLQLLFIQRFGWSLFV